VILRYDLNTANNILVKCSQVFGRDPIFFVIAAADNLTLVFVEEGFIHAEFGYESGLVCVELGVPIASYPGGAFFVSYGIEDRLLGKSRREGVKARFLD
jgi:hypothetical protein